MMILERLKISKFHINHYWSFDGKILYVYHFPIHFQFSRRFYQVILELALVDVLMRIVFFSFPG